MKQILTLLLCFCFANANAQIDSVFLEKLIQLQKLENGTSQVKQLLADYNFIHRGIVRAKGEWEKNDLNQLIYYDKAFLDLYSFGNIVEDKEFRYYEQEIYLKIAKDWSYAIWGRSLNDTTDMLDSILFKKMLFENGFFISDKIIGYYTNDLLNQHFLYNNLDIYEP